MSHEANIKYEEDVIESLLIALDDEDEQGIERARAYYTSNRKLADFYDMVTDWALRNRKDYQAFLRAWDIPMWEAPVTPEDVYA